MPLLASLGTIGRVLLVAAVVVVIVEEITTFVGTGNLGYFDGSVQFNSPRGIAVASSGIMYVADENNHRIRKITPAGVVSLFAGDGGAGFFDGTGTNSRFNQPTGIAVDSSGNVYVGDRMNHRIRKITPAGVVTTLAGTTAGYTNGTGTNAQFTQPLGVAVDSSGNVYVVDAGKRVCKITPLGVVTTLAGDGTNAIFNSPYGVAVDLNGNVYVSDTSNFRVRKVTSSGVVSTLAGSGIQGFADGNGTTARFNSLYEITTDSKGNIYVSDQIYIRKITPGGIVSTLAGNGFYGIPSLIGDGIATNIPVSPYGIAADSSDNLFFTENVFNRIRKVSSGVVVTTIAGSGVGGSTSSEQPPLFWRPHALAFDSAGILYIVDQANHCIRKMSRQGIVTTLAGGGSTTSAGFVDGVGLNARFNQPFGVAVDSIGNVYVADSFNNRIRKITPAGVVSTYPYNYTYPQGIAVDSANNIYVSASGQHYIDRFSDTSYYGIYVGSPGVSGFTNGTGTAALMNCPQGIAVDSSGILYIVDQLNQCIRRVSTAREVTIFAGTQLGSFASTGTSDSAVGGGVRFNSPLGIAVDSAGNVYVADTQNSRIRKLTPPSGGSTTLAGSTSGFTDGTGTNARLSFPEGVAVDSSGNVFVGDCGNARVRMITQAGVVTTASGSTSGFTDGGWFNTPVGVSTNWNGTLFVADRRNHRIRRITPAGVVSTFAGSGTAGATNSTGTSASFNFPQGTAVNSAGTVYVADSTSRQIRAITSAGVVTTFAGSTTSGFADGTGTSATFNTPVGITVDTTNTVYVADSGNHNIRRITTAGVVTTLAGSRTATFADGVGTNASFNTPSGIVADIYGNVYVADTNNHRIRRITSDGTVTTLAGQATAGFANGIGTSAQFNFPYHLSIDELGTLYVADQTNHRIRTVQTSTGVVTRVAGDGTAGFTSLRFNTPQGIAVDRFRNAYVADTGNHSIRKIANVYSYQISSVATTLAGSGNGTFFDGTGTLASFVAPSAIAVDYFTGNIIVVDQSRIRRITPAGVVAVLAGNSSFSGLNGTGESATFYLPEGVTVDSVGNIYVGDRYNNCIRKVTSGGVVTTFSGSTNAGSTDGVSTTATYNNPCGVAMAPYDGTYFYVADTNGNRIRYVQPSGYVTTPLGNGTQASVDGTGTSASFWNPFGIAVRPNQTFEMYVTEIGSHRIRKIDSGYRVTTFAGSSQGYADGSGTNAQFNTPRGIAVDSAGNVYVADTGNNRIRMITPNGVVTTLLGDGTAAFSNGTGTNATFNAPWGVAVDFAGTLYVTDMSNKRIRIIKVPFQLPLNRGVVTTFAGNGTQTTVNGTGTNATFANPLGVAVDSAGTVYVSDYSAHNIRRITPAGVVTTLAGGTFGFADSTGTNAQFNGPRGVAVDSVGNVFVADFFNNRIRRITPGGVVSTLAGQATSGSADGTGVSASFWNPRAVAVDSAGNVYVADTSNNRVRRITPAGVVTTFAGSTSGSTDGTGTNARFDRPEAIAVDSVGNVYTTDGGHTIRRITPQGVVTTIAGNGTQGSSDGIGTNATFRFPNGIAVDSAGNLYISQDANSIIRRITPDGVVTTFAGSGTAGFANGTGTNAIFQGITNIAVDSGGIVYVGESNNARIRKIQ